jgi:hypothetical protein
MSVLLVDESFTAVYSTTLVSETDAPILLAQLTGLTLTYYDVRTSTVLNGRNVQNVLNTNNVTYHATSGLLTWTMQPADVAIVAPDLPVGYYERHQALFRWSWDTPTKTGGENVAILVEQLLFVP